MASVTAWRPSRWPRLVNVGCGVTGRCGVPVGSKTPHHQTGVPGHDRDHRRELLARALAAARGIPILTSTPVEVSILLLAQLQSHGIRLVPIRYEGRRGAIWPRVAKTTGKVAAVLATWAPARPNLHPRASSPHCTKASQCWPITSQHRLGIVYLSPPSTFQDRISLTCSGWRSSGRTDSRARIPGSGADGVPRDAQRPARSGSPRRARPVLYGNRRPDTAPVWPAGSYRWGQIPPRNTNSTRLPRFAGPPGR